ncbi:hypothetical protein [Desulfosporosinus sp. FKA]|uniref:hypothetical protein n=1 Tax=Desulfosporosinus sp. FKA TaxID=1969834 RepID=UPI000B49B613|nr:hypothetical protein [Desulfosporosinus sp. FKA]
MINQIIESCRRISFQVNLFELLEGLSILVLIAVIVLLQRKILSYVRKESIIDERIRETSARIARVVAEIEESKEETKEEIKGQSKEETCQAENSATDLVSSKQETDNNVPKGKKTRAMSMEERWAEFEKKRAIRTTA